VTCRSIVFFAQDCTILHDIAHDYTGLHELCSAHDNCGLFPFAMLLCSFAFFIYCFTVEFIINCEAVILFTLTALKIWCEIQ